MRTTIPSPTHSLSLLFFLPYLSPTHPLLISTQPYPPLHIHTTPLPTPPSLHLPPPHRLPYMVKKFLVTLCTQKDQLAYPSNRQRNSRLKLMNAANYLDIGYKLIIYTTNGHLIGSHDNAFLLPSYKSIQQSNISREQRQNYADKVLPV